MTKQIAIVTGASRGIGRAIAMRLARDGTRVALVARSADQLADVRDAIVAEALASGKTAAPMVLACDLCDEAAVVGMVREVSRHGTPSILVHNAGYGGPIQALDQVSSAEWDRVFGVNVRAAYVMLRELLPAMARDGRGAIVNVCSTHAMIGASGSAAYCASKHALLGLTRAVAAEWGRKGIRCNAVCPGYTRTDMIGAFADDPKLLSRIPNGRVGTPEEVAEAVAFLCGSGASAINGAALTVDGGMLADLGV
jgi:3-oxoacyl-[acyl-carrier protein] reductase